MDSELIRLCFFVVQILSAIPKNIAGMRLKVIFCRVCTSLSTKIVEKFP